MATIEVKDRMIDRLASRTDQTGVELREALRQTMWRRTCHNCNLGIFTCREHA